MLSYDAVAISSSVCYLKGDPRSLRPIMLRSTEGTRAVGLGSELSQRADAPQDCRALEAEPPRISTSARCGVVCTYTHSRKVVYKTGNQPLQIDNTVHIAGIMQG